MTPPLNTCWFDRIPDEILLQILLELLATEREKLEATPLWLQHCADLPRFHMAERAEGWEWLPEEIKADRDSLVCTKAQVDERLKTTTHPSQTGHLQDWLAINSTCRRFRRLGKPYYFATRRLVLSANLLNRFKEGDSVLNLSREERQESYIRHRQLVYASLADRMPEVRHPYIRGEGPRLLGLSTEDQKKVIDQATDILFLGVSLTAPSTLLGLPKLLSSLPKLRSCWLMLGHHMAPDVESFTVYREDKESKSHVSKTVAELKDLLVDIGLKSSLELGFALSPGYMWDQHAHFLTHNAYPVLRVKRDMMQRAKSSISSNHKPAPN